MHLNRKITTKNSYQGTYKKVLCVCSASCLRSPTAAVVLSQEPYNFKNRSCGIDKDFAIIPLDEVLLEWADEVVCMDTFQKSRLTMLTKKPIVNLNIDDVYEYRNKELIELIKANYRPPKTFKFDQG